MNKVLILAANHVGPTPEVQKWYQEERLRPTVTLTMTMMAVECHFTWEARVALGVVTTTDKRLDSKLSFSYIQPSSARS